MMQLKIKTLTPIWTGNIERKSEKLRETSIIGSLRWWFEAIVRGLGGDACDSVGESTKKCEYKDEKYKEGAKPQDICPVCYVFGTTGWGRRFRLEIDENTYKSEYLELAIDGLYCEDAPNNNNVEWWFKQTLGGFKPTVIKEKTNDGILLNIISHDSVIVGIIYLTIKTIQEFGALGSHNSYGFGVVKVLEPSDVNIDSSLEFVKKYIEKQPPEESEEEAQQELPNLKYAFKIDFEVQQELDNKNVGFILKYAMRNKFRKEYDKKFAEKLFGSKKDNPNKFSGKVFVSNIWEEDESNFLRVYGMLPPSILGSTQREEIIGVIKNSVSRCLGEVEIVQEANLWENSHLEINQLKRLVVKK